MEMLIIDLVEFYFFINFRNVLNARYIVSEKNIYIYHRRNLIGRESRSRLRPVSSLEFQLFQFRFGGTEQTSLSLLCGLFQMHTLQFKGNSNDDLGLYAGNYF